MKTNDNVIYTPRNTVVPAPASNQLFIGLLWGALGVLAFSGTLPATKLAVSSMDSTVVGLGRAVIAGACGALLLAATGQRLPSLRQWRRLLLVTLGVVLGFPLLSAYAMHQVPSSHGAIVVGLLPAATAAMAVVRAGERPSLLFWLAAGLGAVTVIGFAAVEGLGQLRVADGLLLGAVFLAALGYAEGGVLARELGSWQVICWALLLGAPVCLPLSILALGHGEPPTVISLLGFTYVSVVSMFLGFFAWYRGLALGGIARVGQLQLMQPILTLLWSRLLLGETLTAWHFVAAIAVFASVILTLRLR